MLFCVAPKCTGVPTSVYGSRWSNKTLDVQSWRLGGRQKFVPHSHTLASRLKWAQANARWELSRIEGFIVTLDAFDYGSRWFSKKLLDVWSWRQGVRVSHSPHFGKQAKVGPGTMLRWELSRIECLCNIGCCERLRLTFSKSTMSPSLLGAFTRGGGNERPVFNATVRGKCVGM